MERDASDARLVVILSGRVPLRSSAGRVLVRVPTVAADVARRLSAARDVVTPVHVLLGLVDDTVPAAVVPRLGPYWRLLVAALNATDRPLADMALRKLLVPLRTVHSTLRYTKTFVVAHLPEVSHSRGSFRHDSRLVLPTLVLEDVPIPLGLQVGNRSSADLEQVPVWEHDFLSPVLVPVARHDTGNWRARL